MESVQEYLKSITQFENLINTVAVSAVLVFYGALLVRFFRDERFRKRIERANRRFLGSIFSVFGAFFGAKVEFDREDAFRIDEDRIVELLRTELSAGGIQLSDASEAEIVGYFRESLRGELGGQIRSELRDLLSREVDRSVFEMVDQNLRRARNRLEEASRSVSVRGVFSLIIGIISAAAAFSLIYSVVGIVDLETVESMPLNTVVYLSIGRLSLAVFVTFISYFFLSLYRRSLDEIQHYQSEMTNIDAWIASILAASFSKSDQLLSYAVAKLLEVDRNAMRANTVSTNDSNDQVVRVSSDLLKSIIAKIPVGK